MNVSPTSHLSQVATEIGANPVNIEAEQVEPKFQKIEVSTFCKIKNVFLDIVTFGYWLYKANRELSQALEQKDWQKAAEAIEHGPVIWDVAETCLGFVRKGNYDAATFLLCQKTDYDGYEYDNKCYKWYCNFENLEAKEMFMRRNMCKKAFTVFTRAFPADDSHVIQNYQFRLDYEIFFKALEKKDYSLADFLLKEITKQIKVDNIRDSIGMHRAFDNFNVDNLRFWIKHGLPVDMVERPDRNQSLLWFSVVKGDLDSAKFLLENGASTKIAANYSIPSGTPLRAAVSMENIAMVKLLLKHNADPHERMDDTNGTSQMHKEDNTSAFELALIKQNSTLIKAFSGYVDDKSQKIIDAYDAYV